MSLCRATCAQNRERNCYAASFFFLNPHVATIQQQSCGNHKSLKRINTKIPLTQNEISRCWLSRVTCSSIFTSMLKSAYPFSSKLTRDQKFHHGIAATIQPLVLILSFFGGVPTLCGLPSTHTFLLCRTS
jgi:hypothetical protein